MTKTRYSTNMNTRMPAKLKILLIAILALCIPIAFGLFLIYSPDKPAPVESVNTKPDQAHIFFGFLRTVHQEPDGLIAEIDPAVMLSGPEARRLAAIDTGCPEATVQDCVLSLENDFYIRNTSTVTDRYKITPNTTIRLFSTPGSPDLYDANSEILKNTYSGVDKHMTFSAFNFEATGQLLTKMEIVYMP